MASDQVVPNMASDQELPSDMIVEILSRTTSLETLDTCKAVCKDWKQLTNEPDFMPLYCRRTNNLSGYFIQDIRNNKPVSKFITINQSGEEKADCIKSSRYEDMRILASCNQGILCCEKEKYHSRRYYTCKPATQQWQALPNPKLRYPTIGVAIMVLRSTPLRYKIVRVSQEKPLPMCVRTPKLQYRFEIFDSETWSWREAKGWSGPYDEFILSSSPSIWIGDSVYWKTNNDKVAMFHVSREQFDTFPMPEATRDINLSKQPLEYEGRLGITCQRGDNMELWLATRSTKEWTKKTIVNIKDIQRNIDEYISFLDFYNSQTWFMSTMFGAMFYKLQDGTCTRVKWDKLNFAREFFQFRSNLEYVDLKGRK